MIAIPWERERGHVAADGSVSVSVSLMVDTEGRVTRLPVREPRGRAGVIDSDGHTTVHVCGDLGEVRPRSGRCSWSGAPLRHHAEAGGEQGVLGMLHFTLSRPQSRDLECIDTPVLSEITANAHARSQGSQEGDSKAGNACRFGHMSISIVRTAQRPAMETTQRLDVLWQWQERLLSNEPSPPLAPGPSRAEWSKKEGRLFDIWPLWMTA